MGSDPLPKYCVIHGRKLFTLFLSFMFNKLFNNIVVRHGHSNCAEYIIANIADGVARVAYKNGMVYEYTNVSRRALLAVRLTDLGSDRTQRYASVAVV